MQRLFQIVLIVSLITSCWLGMQMVHELGHVLGAWWTGGVVSKVVLRPWTISRTELSSNPDPLFVAWAGPLVGALLPVALWLVARLARFPSSYLLRFFASFCLVANGLYLGVGAFSRIGDAGDIQRHGSEFWMLVLVGAVTVPAGLWLWHGQGRHFGFGGAEGRVNRYDVAACALTLALLVVLTFSLGSS